MFIVCLNSNWCHITQQNKESTRVWDGGKGECLCIFLMFLTIKAKYAPIHIMVFHAHS